MASYGRCSSGSMWLILLVANLAACAIESGGCPECPDSGLRDAAATCEPVSFRCFERGLETSAERCAYDDANGCFVRVGRFAVACPGDCSTCDVALRQLRVDACAASVDACAANPCLNGGSCSAGPSGFTCTCAPGFGGTLCDQNVNECAFSPCAPAQRCLDTHGSYACLCPTGFTGEDCTEDVDECVFAPCKNGGTCTNLPGSFACVCPVEFGGPTCEVDRHVCRGTAVTCGVRSVSLCTTGRGCQLTTGCRGTPSSCASRSASTCTQQPGCWYSSSAGGCFGSPPACNTHTTVLSCNSVSGCAYLADTCLGTASSCDSLSPAECTSQLGCSLVLP